MSQATTQSNAPALIPAAEIETFLKAHAGKDLLRFITCGSVDDGKSTLIGRLLFDSKMIFEDQLTALENDSKKVGTVADGIDFALLVDGLAAEREQGITIDVAYRFFTTESRKFIVIDAPGHEQYTRNMVTGASHADVAVILIDARKGVLTQSRRHSAIASMLGIRHVILAVNKMDLVGYDQAVFEEIKAEYRSFADRLGIETVVPIPLSALKGDNLTGRGDAMPWYDGPTVLEVLEAAPTAADRPAANRAGKPLGFRMAVQWVNRPNLDFRGFSGTLSGGPVTVGDAVVALPSERESRIARIVTSDGDLQSAQAGQAITLVLEDEIDVSRGDVLAAANDPADVTDQVQAHLVWMDEEEMLPERQYLLKIGAHTVTAQVTSLKHTINVNSLEEGAASTLGLNDIAVCNLSFDQAVALDSFKENPALGGFVMIDRYTNLTVGAGMVDYGLRRATNLVWQETDISKESRAEQKGQKPCVLWFTGLSGSGKSTVANMVEKRLASLNRHTYMLDGDNVRHGLNRDLGFTEADRVENIRRVAEVSKLFVDAGLIVLVSFISPFKGERQLARDLLEEGEFLEVHVDASLALCEERDPKGLYQKARDGQIKNFTGIDSPYEAPENPEIRLDTGALSPEAAAEKVLAVLKDRGFV